MRRKREPAPLAGWVFAAQAEPWRPFHLKEAVANGHHRKLQPRNPLIIRNYWAVKSWALWDKPRDIKDMSFNELDTQSQLVYNRCHLGSLKSDDLHLEPYERDSRNHRQTWWQYLSPEKKQWDAHHFLELEHLRYQDSCMKGTDYERNFEKRALFRTIRKLKPNEVRIDRLPNERPACDTIAIMLMINRALEFTVETWANKPQSREGAFLPKDEPEDLIDSTTPTIKQVPTDFESMGVPTAPAPPLPRQGTLPNVLGALRTSAGRATEPLRRNQTWTGQAQDKMDRENLVPAPSATIRSFIPGGDGISHEAEIEADQSSQEWGEEFDMVSRDMGSRLLPPPAAPGCHLHGWGYEARCDDCHLGAAGVRDINLRL